MVWNLEGCTMMGVLQQLPELWFFYFIEGLVASNNPLRQERLELGLVPVALAVRQ